MTQSNITLNDCGVRFDPEGHRYFLGSKELQGITSTLIRKAFPDTYKDIPESVLQAAARRGTAVHELIELYCSVFDSDAASFPADQWTPELRAYADIIRDNGLHYLRSEYLVTDGERFASAIDGVYINDSGGIVLVDYKTTYSLYTESVALQLSLYARFFELVNPGLKVCAIACIWLRHDKSRYVEMGRVDDKTLDALVEATANDDPDYTYSPPVPDAVYDLEFRYLALNLEIQRLQRQQDAVKDKLSAIMQANNAQTYRTGKATYSLIPESNVRRFDSAAFRKAEPVLYDRFSKMETKKKTIRITIKNK